MLRLIWPNSQIAFLLKYINIQTYENSLNIFRNPFCSKVQNIEETKKIRELVDLEENSLTENEKSVLGLVDDD